MLIGAARFVKNHAADDVWERAVALVGRLAA
jgi:hypothetical protein